MSCHSASALEISNLDVGRQLLLWLLKQTSLQRSGFSLLGCTNANVSRLTSHKLRLGGKGKSKKD